ncbi:hypothetical protein JL722_3900 [Aureococcus anophagefferens]|nr:hypothetical protein JL722_3900 [Aureococcus anophagefferens]
MSHPFPAQAESYPAAFVPSLLALLVAEDAVLAYEATVVFKNLFVAEDLLSPVVAGLVAVRAGKESEIPNFKGSDLGREGPGDRGLALGKARAAEILMAMLRRDDVGDVRVSVATMLEKNAVRVLLRVVTDKGPAVDADVNLACVRLLSLLYDADDDGGVVQRMVQDMLVPLQKTMESMSHMGEVQHVFVARTADHAAHTHGDAPETRLLPLLVCHPERFHREVMTSTTLAAMMRRCIARGRRDEHSALHGHSARGAPQLGRFTLRPHQKGGGGFFVTQSAELSALSADHDASDGAASARGASPEPSRARGLFDESCDRMTVKTLPAKVIDRSRFKRRPRLRGERRIKASAFDDARRDFDAARGGPTPRPRASATRQAPRLAPLPGPRPAGPELRRRRDGAEYEVC